MTYELFSPFGPRLARVEGRVTEQAYPTRSAIFQPQFESILFEGVRRFKSVDVRFGHELTDFVDDGSRVVLQLKDDQGATRTVAARYVLAADGSHSVVRKKLGLSFDELVPFGLRHIVIDVANDDNDSLVATTRLGWRRNGASLPTPGGRRRYEFSLLPGEDSDALLEEKRLAGLFGKFGFDVPRQVIRKTAYTFHARLASRMQQGRVFLLGDAAHIMPVFGSQGMNSGARDANNLVWKISAVLRGITGSELLDTYEEERREQVARTIRAATAAGKWQEVSSLATMAVRHVAYLGITVLPPIRRFFANLRYIPKPSIDGGFSFPRAGSEGQAIVGQVLPNPLVNDGASDRLLDGVLGAGFALIGVGVDAGDTHGLEHPIWRVLGARVVRLATSNAPKAAGDASVILRDQRLGDVVAAVGRAWLLVRPDRIVAAVVSPRDLKELGDEVSARLGVAAEISVQAAE